VSYSVTTSTQADAPRAKNFPQTLDRLNVATSRANAALFESEGRSPVQIRLANAFCTYLEMANAL